MSGPPSPLIELPAGSEFLAHNDNRPRVQIRPETH
ncbi:hypothetical protein Goshw_028526 [Gossypium schwendimanii]|uniref:Uncharacterized protein n=1 Tax=Gossypium schwendimanii TaxID=34291 RepID=A0A7J9NAP6_GOSSC|nr:hypothetical protein [Gossypium schwendimanii]